MHFLAYQMPASLAGQKNGLLDPMLLVDSHLRGFKIAVPAADPFGALMWAAYRDGVPLDATGIYRSYGQQVTLFESRYSPDISKALRKSDGTPLDARRYEGQTWYRFQGASAAVPGTSIHGWGMAVDFAMQADEDPEPESLNQSTVTWLEAKALDYGWSWELVSELWHLRVVTGDAVTVAVQDWIAAGRPAWGNSAPTPPVPDPTPEATLKDMPTLKQGATGNAVVTLQTLLIQRGIWSDKPANRDGVFGSGTDAGVRKFQSARHITVDGVVGGQTWAELGHA